MSGNKGADLPNSFREGTLQDMPIHSGSDKIRTIAATGTLCAVVLAPTAAWAAAGDLDLEFGAHEVTSGQVTTSFSNNKDSIYALALQPDQKIVAVGVTEDQMALARYNADGTLDAGFGDEEGKADNRVGKEAEARAVALQPDGKIVVAGFNMEPGVGTHFALRRYLPEGKTDTSFGYKGAVTTNIGSKEDAAYAVAVLPDGKILAVGTSGSKVGLVRYTDAGELDTAFGTNGSVATPAGEAARGSAVSVQPDGKVVVAGSSDGDVLLARYEADGSLDPSFGKDGLAVTDLGTQSDAATGVAVQADGKIVAAGSADGQFATARFTADGKLDTDFGDGGKNLTQIGQAAHARGLGIQKDGKIVVAGYENRDDTGDSIAVVRYTAEGLTDLEFGKAGVAISDFGTPSDRGHAVVIQDDGKIVVGGRSKDPVTGDSFALTRFLGA